MDVTDQTSCPVAKVEQTVTNEFGTGSLKVVVDRLPNHSVVF